jgi:hypothetical protein
MSRENEEPKRIPGGVSVFLGKLLKKGQPGVCYGFRLEANPVCRSS